MTARFENIIEVVIYNRDGFAERDYFQVRDVVIASKPDYWQLYQPHEIISYFLQRKKGKKRSDNLVSSIQQLKNTSPLFASLGVGIDQMNSIVEANFWGKMKSMPLLGKSDAAKHAKQDASIGVAG